MPRLLHHISVRYQPRMDILEVAVEYGLNWPLKGKNAPYFTATYRGDGF